MGCDSSENENCDGESGSVAQDSVIDSRRQADMARDTVRRDLGEADEGKVPEWRHCATFNEAHAVRSLRPTRIALPGEFGAPARLAHRIRLGALYALGGGIERHAPH